MNLQSQQQKPTSKFLNFVRSIALFSKNKIEQAKAKLFLGEHKTVSRHIKDSNHSRSEGYTNPVIEYLKPDNRKGTLARVSRSLALVLINSGEAEFFNKTKS